MKKIIAILLALALVSMAFADGSVTNTVSTEPKVTIDGAGNYWQFDPVIKEEIKGDYTTEDGRAHIEGKASMQLNWVEKTANKNILSFSPRWKFSKNGAEASGWVKPFDNLKISLNSGDSVGGPGIKWVGCSWKDVGILKPSSTEGGTGGSIGVTYSLLDEHLQLMAGLVDGTWIKKGAYGPFNLGVKFKATDDISVGVKWEGQFGGYNPNINAYKGSFDSVTGLAKDVEADSRYIDGLAGATDKRYQKHGFYVGAELNMFKDAKVGTTLGVGFSFTSTRASVIMGTPKTTEFAGTVSAGFDFNNSIKDDVWVTVGWRNYDGKKTKVLPFAVGNTLTYSVSDDATFSLDTSYAQSSMTLPKKTYDEGKEWIGQKEPDGVLAGLNKATDYTGVIHIKPEFSFKLSKHTFKFGVETDVFNRMYHWNKTDTDWAYSAARGIYAKVAMPISWSYTF